MSFHKPIRDNLFFFRKVTSRKIPVTLIGILLIGRLKMLHHYWFYSSISFVFKNLIVLRRIMLKY